MEILFWFFIFVLSSALLIKGADWFVESSERIALALKISPFIVGVTIVAIGTSFPELASCVVAVLKGKSEIVMANVVGSNIANILLIVGGAAIVARTLIVRKSLIDLDAPLLAVSTALLFLIALDGKISLFEGVLLLLAFLVFFFYTLFQRREEVITPELVEILPEGIKLEILPSRVERRRDQKREKIEKIEFGTIIFLIFGVIGLIVGANFTVDSMVKIAEILKIPTSLIVIVGLAIGTSLPEMVVSIRAAAKKRYEIALGNVFGSNVFNVLLITGISSLIKPLTVDKLVVSIGLPFLAFATFLFVISGISRRIHLWEGAMYWLIYILFIFKLYSSF
jgi:cation:H+ antiporter